VKGTDDLGLDGFAPGELHLSIVKVPEVRQSARIPLNGSLSLLITLLKE
jgi:hypothetical protein